MLLVFKDNGPTQFCIDWSESRNSIARIARYLTDAAEDGGTGAMNNMLDFWSSRRAVYNCILPLAENSLSAPASQAYVELVF